MKSASSDFVTSHMEYCLPCISFSKLTFLQQQERLVGNDVASHIENATVSHDTSVSIDIY